MRRDLIGVCGDDCQCCPRYVATQDGSPQELERVKELWVRLGLREPSASAHEMVCQGCRPENECAYAELRACAQERAVANCGLCDAYACELVNAAFDRTEKLHMVLEGTCTATEMVALERAFLSKRQNLDAIHREMEGLRAKKQGEGFSCGSEGLPPGPPGHCR